MSEPSSESTAGKTGHYLSADRMYVYGIVGGRVFSRYQVSALLQNCKMPKLTTPGSPIGWVLSDKNDPVKWIRALEENGYILLSNPSPQGESRE
jgi:hypothetical protein